MKTPTTKTEDIAREWHVVDASDQVVGRLATQVARILRGKHKPIFSPDTDTGDFVVIVNAEKARFTGRKEESKLYWRYTQYVGGERSVSVAKQREDHPERILIHAIKGMLPKNPLGRKMAKKLKVYAGPAHPHAAQKPKVVNF
jgi:large subunit ribosomal protein L13